MRNLVCYSLILTLCFLACKSSRKKHHVEKQLLTNNATYRWGNIFSGGEIKISNLSDTGFEFEFKPYGDVGKDMFVFPKTYVNFISDSIAEANISGVRFTLHIHNRQSITLNENIVDSKSPLKMYEHLFIKDYVLRDNLPSLPFLSKQLNYRIKQKMDVRINDFIEYLKVYKTQTIKDSIFTIKNYFGKKVISDDTEVASILIRDDTFFTAAIMTKKSVHAYSNDPVYGRKGVLDDMFYDWFHNSRHRTISCSYYSAFTDSASEIK